MKKLAYDLFGMTIVLGLIIGGPLALGYIVFRL